MNMLGAVSRFGRNAAKAVAPIFGASEQPRVEPDPEQMFALRAEIDAAERFASLQAHPAWKEFEQLLKAMLIKKQEALEKASIGDVPVLQAQVRELRLVLSIVPESVRLGDEAKAEMNRLTTPANDEEDDA